jgi:hypothetical protein
VNSLKASSTVLLSLENYVRYLYVVSDYNAWKRKNLVEVQKCQSFAQHLSVALILCNGGNQEKSSDKLVVKHAKQRAKPIISKS